MRDSVFTTSNVDLAAFLLYSEEDFVSCDIHPDRESVVVMSFNDPHGKCVDLERVFIHSEFKKYRELHKWLLGQIHNRLKRK